jgi:hypothetical protein
MKSPEPTDAPNQYGPGRCTECQRPLSRYNPYVVCGPCRVRLADNIAREIAVAEYMEDRGFAWELFPKREPVWRGPLLPETKVWP